MTEETMINGKKITELSDMFFEYCKLKKEMERLQEENEKLKKILENEKLKKIFKKIDKLLNEALDAEVTDMEQSLDRLYTISEMINEVLNDRD